MVRTSSRAQFFANLARLRARGLQDQRGIRHGTDTAEEPAMTKARFLLCVLLFGCGDASGDSSQEEVALFEARLLAQATNDAGDEASSIEAPFERVMQECYAQAAGSRTEVHTVGRYLARADAMQVVRVSIPGAPRLARCIEEAVMREVPPGWTEAPDSWACGSFAIDLGGPAPRAQLADIARQLEEHEQGVAALLREGVERGVLPADHPLVQELLDRR
jgi:hypothetical protein